MQSKVNLIVLVIICSLSFGCTGPSFYIQALGGHFEVLRNAVDIKDIDMASLSKTERQKINLTVQVRQFAKNELALSSKGSFHAYSKLDRQFVVWNVFAARKFSLTPKKTCFLVAGCVPYRGFFSKSAAKNYAEKLIKNGFDVYVAGIGAYSTLGWFDDPLLSTVINRSDESLAELVIHELTHQKIYFKNDAEFNESFATAIAQEGVQRWLNFNNALSEKKGDELQKEEELTKLILGVKLKLDTLYHTDETLEKKKLLKEHYFERLETDYSALKNSWGTSSPYDAYMYEPWNNAKIMSFGAYHQLVPKFKELIRIYDGDLPEVYRAVERVEKKSKKQRRELLFSRERKNKKSH